MTRVHADIESIKALRAALLTFSGREMDALALVESEIVNTQVALHGAEQQCRYEIARRALSLIGGLPDAFAALETGQEAIYEAHESLNRVIDGASYSSGEILSHLAQVALSYIPIVSGLGEGYRLIEATYRLIEIQLWQRRIDEASLYYRSFAQRFESVLSNDLPHATSFLADRIAALEAYHAAKVLAGVMALATSGEASLMGAVIGAMRSLRGEMSRVLGSAGEQAAAQVLTEEFAFQELPFDQPKHGFDRVFRAPGIPLIVMEAKVSSSGTLQLGQTEAGQQGSPGWVAVQAEKMVDRDSAQWSPANERIGRLAQELGPENVPVVSVVVNPATNRGNVYVRQRSGNWQLLHEGLVLEPTGPVTPAESREGGAGGAERRG